MKVAFVGKGGSGKTTLSALFCRHLATQNVPVLAMDADINQHLGVALGMSEAEARDIPALGLGIEQIKAYVRGTNPRITSVEAMMKTTPPGPGSQLLHIQEDNPLYAYFIRTVQHIRLMVTGPFSEEDLGLKCYHSKVGAVELLLNHLVDGKHEYVVVDMTAGADSFASGLFTRFDLTFIVVEPTLRSVSVYQQYIEYARDHNVQVYVIGNKVESEDDLTFLHEQVGDALLGCIGRSHFVRAMEKGHQLPFSELERENLQTLALMQNAVDGCIKDWDKFYRQAVLFHQKNALAWGNARAGEDLTSQVDPEFSLTAYIASQAGRLPVTS